MDRSYTHAGGLSLSQDRPYTHDGTCPSPTCFNLSHEVGLQSLWFIFNVVDDLNNVEQSKNLNKTQLFDIGDPVVF